MRYLMMVLAVVVSMFGFSGVAVASELPPCQYEDSTYDCYWDAQERGNGLGESFKVIDGVVIYEDGSKEQAEADVIPEDVKVEAWKMWDAVGAVELVQAEGEFEVNLIGANSTGFTPSADMIHVWDIEGNHYLFQVVEL